MNRCMRFRMSGLIIKSLVVMLSCSAIKAEAPDHPRSRVPQWPLKTRRVLLTDEQIARARHLCETEDTARRFRDGVLASMEYWLAKSDEELRNVLPDSRVPRAFNVSTEGCPIHGKEIYKNGFYPWKLDRDRPFTIICPIGGERYPSNEFSAYYRTGMKDESLLTGDYADSGRGWISPEGEKYWFVGYACHWNWQKTWLPAVTALSQAYVLTGDRRYARKAIVMLDRIAEIYPGMDYSKQSRYAERTNGNYHGKILNLIWETGVLRRLAEAYDFVFDALVGEDPLSLAWRDAGEIRANIEANLLEEGIDAVARHDIRGNFGMHQSALAYAVTVRQNGPTERLLDDVFTHTGGGHSDEGLNYALYNLVFKDGMPYESSPSYCFGWVSHFVQLADALKLGGPDLYRQPKLKRMFDAPLDMICTGRFTPAIGDAGAIDSEWIGPNESAYKAAYRHLREPRYAWALKHLGALESREAGSFQDLLVESAVEQATIDAAGYHHEPPSRLLDGYGLAILNNPRDSIAVSMYYGVRGGHGHWDTLNIELFGHGRRLSPDLGYPDFMNAFVPGIFSWSKNTISHNCLVVDKKPQDGNHPGKVLCFHDAPTVHVVDVDSAGTYASANVYRRTLVLVDVGEHASYLVDVFRIQGGNDHVLSLHGQEGRFHLTGASLSDPVAEGTLAGRDVAYGQLYDDAVRGVAGYKGSFSGYRGSGYQHFFNWQRVTPDGIVTGMWELAGEPPARLRVHVLPCPDQEVTIADAYVSPTQKIPTVLKYMLVHRSADEAGQMFAVVWEPYRDTPLIDRIELGADTSGGHDSTMVAAVFRGDTVDHIAIAPRPGRMQRFGKGLETDAAVAVVSRKRGHLVRSFAAGGSGVRSGASSEMATIPATLSGVICEVDYAGRRIQVETANAVPDAEFLRHRHVRIFNDRHSSMYAIGSAGWNNGRLVLELTGSDLFTGRAKPESVDAGALQVSLSTRMLYPHVLPGMHLVTEGLAHSAAIVSVNGSTLQLGDDVSGHSFVKHLGGNAEGDLWFSDVGMSDRIEIERFVHETAD